MNRLQKSGAGSANGEESPLWRQHAGLPTCVNFHHPLLMSFARSMFTQLCQRDSDVKRDCVVFGRSPFMPVSSLPSPCLLILCSWPYCCCC